MTNKYIKINEFRYVRYDMESIMLFFQNFTLWIKNPFSSRIEKIFFYKIINYSLYVLYYSKIIPLFYEVVEKDLDWALIYNKWKNKEANVIKVINRKGEYVIQRIVPNNKIYETEKQFYEKYKDVLNGRVRLAPHFFLWWRVIESKFIYGGSLKKRINFWEVSKENSLEIIKTILYELEKWYDFSKKTPTIIHGDLGFSNIFLDDQYIYIIDYSDAIQEDSIYYDSYILLKNFLTSWKYIEQDTLPNLENIPQSLFSIFWNTNKLQEQEKKFLKKNNNKHYW